MKYIITIFLSLIFFSFCKSQIADSGQRFDTLDLSDIILNSSYTIYSSENTLSKLLRKADSITHYIFDGDRYTAFHFGKSSITLFDENTGVKVPIHFEISDNSLIISIKSNTIKIGDNVQILKKIFPNSYAIRNNSTDEGDKDDLIVYFKEYNVLHFKINSSNKIDSISFLEESDY